MSTHWITWGAKGGGEVEMFFDDEPIPEHHNNNKDSKENHACNRLHVPSKHQHISTSTLLNMHNYVIGNIRIEQC